jgi:hypothetical protein
MADDLETVVRYIGIFFREIFRAILDVFATLALLLSCVVPWRLPAIFASFGRVHSRSDYEAMCLTNVAMSAIDILILPSLCKCFLFLRSIYVCHATDHNKMLLAIHSHVCGWLSVFVFAPWRTFFIIRAICKLNDIGDVTKYCAEARGALIVNAICVCADIVTCLPMFVVFASLYRIYPMFKAWCAEPFTTENYDWSAIHRGIVWLQFMLLFLDLAFAIFIFPVLISVYRVPTAWKEMKRTEDRMSKRMVWIVQCFWLLCDIPCALVGIVSLFWIWRIPRFVSHLVSADNAPERRMVCAKNLAFGVKDVAVFFGFIFVVCLLYRALFIFIDLITACKSPTRNDAGYTVPLVIALTHALTHCSLTWSAQSPHDRPYCRSFHHNYPARPGLASG